MSGQSTTPAGWYPDPSDASKQRWWDGNQWTDHQQPAAGYAAPPPAPGYGAVGYAQPQAYGQQPAYGQQQGYGYGAAGGQPPNSHLALAIVSVLIGFWPLGIYAIVKATQVQGLWTSGQYDQAQAAAAAARRWAWVAIGIVLVIAVLFIIAIAAGSSSSSNY